MLDHGYRVGKAGEDFIRVGDCSADAELALYIGMGILP